MTTATVPRMEHHGHPLLRRLGMIALVVALAIVGAKLAYELADVFDGPGAREASVTNVVDTPNVVYGSADAAAQWRGTGHGSHFGSADAAETWMAPPTVPQMGSADATDHWAAR